MKQITTSKGTFIFVEVPDGADLDTIELCSDNELAIGIPNPDPDYLNWITKYIELPDGKYEFICTTSNATEEQAAMVVDSEEITFNGVSHGICYCHYYYKDDVCEWYSGKFNPAVNSLKSLVQHELRLDHAKNYAILKQI